MALSIEQYLTKEFEQDSRNRKCRAGLETRIVAEYRQQMVQQRRGFLMKKKGRMPKAILIATIITVICGFGYAGNKFLFKDHNGKVSISVQTEQQLDLEQGDLEKIRQSLGEVRAQLNLGDTAVVYMKDYDLQAQGVPLVLGVNKPVSIPLSDWKSTLQQHGIHEKLPESFLSTFKFVEGMQSSPFHLNFGLDAYQLLEDMKAESKKTGSKLLWKKTTSSEEGPLVPYTSVYRNSANETIYLTWQVSSGDDNVDMVMAAPTSTSYEAISIGDLAAHYIMNNQSLFVDSHTYQEVTWFQEDAGQTIIYHLQSDSPAVTKEQLIEAAKELVLQ